MIYGAERYGKKRIEVQLYSSKGLFYLRKIEKAINII
jgi:hypothetical protein